MVAMNSVQAVRFFVSFSSRDLRHVREIMAALKGQQLDVWDYSDVIQSIETGTNIDDRLVAEIDACSHMIVVISANSMDQQIGRFCKFELEYALNKRRPKAPRFIPILLGSHHQVKLQPPYDCFENVFCLELDGSSEAIVRFTVKVCQLIEKVYVPPIEAHQNLPFWELFRSEVEQMAHSNKEHVDIMMILGEFNEHYRKADMPRALSLINFFISSCEYKVPNYAPFYPWIVKAVCETELGQFDDAMKSYEKAKMIDPDNQDVIGGIGTVYFKTRQYPKAIACFEQVIESNPTEDTSNARVNRIISKQAMGDPISDLDEIFLFKLDVGRYPDDLKSAILNSQAAQYRVKRDYVALENHCKAIISKNLHDAITLRFLQLSFLNRGMTAQARDVIVKGLEEAKHNTRLNISMLNTFL